MKDSSTVKWIIKKSKSQMGALWFLVILNIIFSAVTVFFAFAVRGIVNGATQDKSKDKIILWTIIIIALVVFQFVLRLLINGLSERVRAKLEIDYRTSLFSSIINKKYKDINKYHSGELMNRMTSDVAMVSDGVTSIIPNVVASVARLLLAIVALIILDPLFAVAFTISGLAVFIVITATRNKLKGLHKEVQETDGKTRSFMQEGIENLLAVKVFSADKNVKNKALNLQDKHFKARMKHRNYSVLGNATYNFIFSAGYLFALIYGALKLFNGTMSYGNLTAILQLVNNVQVPFASLSSVMPKYFAMLASAERIMEIENLSDEKDKEIIDRDEIYKKLNSINFENLTFSYDRNTVLENAYLTINKGEFVVISGISGIGKSTLIKLLLGVYDEYTGEVYLDVDGKKLLATSSTRTMFTYVPQGNMLFSGTLRENLKFINPDVSDEEIDYALTVSEAKEFIKELPNGLETVVGEKGLGLSEGQIQRIAIARAVITKAPIILLDEATSALDEMTEKAVLNNFKNMKDVTLIIISHRKAAKEICDRTIKIVNKKIENC